MGLVVFKPFVIKLRLSLRFEGVGLDSVKDEGSIGAAESGKSPGNVAFTFRCFFSSSPDCDCNRSSHWFLTNLF